MSEPSPSPPAATTSSAKHKPRVSLAIATAFGLGYIPKAPGTFGSLFSVVLAGLWWHLLMAHAIFLDNWIPDYRFPASLAGFAILTSGFGLFASTRVAKYADKKDPQIVVIDEVSGQLISYLGIGAAMPNWKYLLLGFILFRVFDIWKPFPARQAESLPGGLGIMADDWIAGVYAAIGLWALRAFGILS
jgi:phosphatidylglycerophosphatase A